jgi:hypothetical protein
MDVDQDGGFLFIDASVLFNVHTLLEYLNNTFDRGYSSHGIVNHWTSTWYILYEIRYLSVVIYLNSQLQK